jgi:hypothetical protein
MIISSYLIAVILQVFTIEKSVKKTHHSRSGKNNVESTVEIFSTVTWMKVIHTVGAKAVPHLEGEVFLHVDCVTQWQYNLIKNGGSNVLACFAAKLTITSLTPFSLHPIWHKAFLLTNYFGALNAFAPSLPTRLPH